MRYRGEGVAGHFGPARKRAKSLRPVAHARFAAKGWRQFSTTKQPTNPPENSSTGLGNGDVAPRTAAIGRVAVVKIGAIL